MVCLDKDKHWLDKLNRLPKVEHVDAGIGKAAHTLAQEARVLGGTERIYEHFSRIRRLLRVSYCQHSLYLSFLSLSLSFSLSFSPSISFSFYICSYLSLSLLSISFFLSMSIPLSLSISLLYVFLPLFISLSLSISLFISISLYLFLTCTLPFSLII